MTALPFHVETVPSVGVTVEHYAELHGLSVRTVRRWLAAGELPTATKTGDVWSIPANAERVPGAGNAMAPVAAGLTDAVAAGAALMRQQRQGQQLATAAPATPSLAGELDTLPAYLHLEDAARLLGVDPYVIVRNADHFGAVRWGELTAGKRRSWLVPAATVRQIAGL